MTCRIHCRHPSTGFDFYLEYNSWEVADAMAKRLAEQGYQGVGQPSRPATDAPGTGAALLQRLDHVEQLLIERETQLLHLVEDVQAQRQLALEREARLLLLMELDTIRPSPPAEAPQPAAPANGSRPTAPDQPAAAPPMPHSWHEILSYLQQHPGLQCPAEVQQGLGWSKPTRDYLRRMYEAGILRRDAGSYELAQTTPGARDPR